MYCNQYQKRNMELWGGVVVRILNSYHCFLLCKNSTPVQHRIPLVPSKTPENLSPTESQQLKISFRNSCWVEVKWALPGQRAAWKSSAAVLGKCPKKPVLKSCSEVHHKITRGNKLLTLNHKMPAPNSSSWGSPSPYPCCWQGHVPLSTVIPYQAALIRQHPTQHQPLLLLHGHLNSS